jgi:hypothetical protein
LRRSPLPAAYRHASARPQSGYEPLYIIEGIVQSIDFIITSVAGSGVDLSDPGGFLPNLFFIFLLKLPSQLTEHLPPAFSSKFDVILRGMLAVGQLEFCVIRTAPAGQISSHSTQKMHASRSNRKSTCFRIFPDGAGWTAGDALAAIAAF